ncbi:DUF4349 domain-containing protein [Actinoplanes sp. KI2]|uniref:DUF4349 domain-containing protein n=1 Tax=Actinoplanes sp. KI2 TaxID=2983315 RepID=UPI0021D5D638|nr:DUF4349 domain-containing protein [Actinoplanes sp. KI2]MCU7726723.1 DUF4349 domain-containing protein [Actinoplanes sp. KI2]
MRVNHRKTTYVLASALVAGALLTGCSAGDSSNMSSSSGVGTADKAAEPQRADGGAAQVEQQPATAKDQPAQQSPNLAVDQRSIIYRGSSTVRVKDSVNAAAGQATGIAVTAGGFIGSDNRTTGEGGSDTATLTLRVPADKFTTVVDQLARLGKEEHREINTEDVTEETVDLDARIQVQQARVDSGRKLLAQAKTLNDLVMLEKEVATRQSDLASLQAKKRKLADLTALSTITVTFLGPAAPAPKPEPENPGGFLGGLTAGWHALLASLKVVLTVVGALLPWAIVLGLPLWLAFYLYRRYGRGRLTPPQPTLAPAGTPPLPSAPPISEQPAPEPQTSED